MGDGNHVWSDVTDDNCMSGLSASHNTGHRQQQRRKHSNLSADGQTRVENVARTRREVARVLEGRVRRVRGAANGGGSSFKWVGSQNE